MPSSSSRPQGLLHRAQLQLLTPEPSPLCPAHDPGAFSTMPSSSSRPWSLLHRAQLQFPQEFLSPSLISPFLQASAAPTLLQTIRLATSKQPTSWDLQIPTRGIHPNIHHRGNCYRTASLQTADAPLRESPTNAVELVALALLQMSPIGNPWCKGWWWPEGEMLKTPLGEEGTNPTLTKASRGSVSGMLGLGCR